MQEPKRPYKNFADYRAKAVTEYGRIREVIVLNPTAWPCIECKGDKRVVDPDSLGVYQERATYLPCPRCKKTGLGTEAEHRDIYRKEIADHKEKHKRYRELMRAYRAAVKKLTSTDIEILKQFGFKPQVKKHASPTT
jgi:hypothetical protein